MADATLMIVAIFYYTGVFKEINITLCRIFFNQRNNSTVAINSISGINTNACMYCVAVFAIISTLVGTKVIVYADVIQLSFLILGLLVTTFLWLTLLPQIFTYPAVINGKIV